MSATIKVLNELGLEKHDNGMRPTPGRRTAAISGSLLCETLEICYTHVTSTADSSIIV